MSLRFIVDGYNILNHQVFPRKQNRRKGATCPELLVFINANRLTGSPKNKLSIIFDGYPPAESFCAGSDPDPAMIFSRSISADEKIINIIEGSAQRKNIIVVSDDKQVRAASSLLGAKVLGVEEFICPEGKKEKRVSAADRDSAENKVSYSQMHEINRELEARWLKEV